MSYTYLLEQGVESSAECFSAIEQSVLSSLTRTAGACSCNDNETESCRCSRFGMMSTPSMEIRGAESLMSSALESPAKKSALLERVEDLSVRTTTNRSRELFAKLDLDLCSWKIPHSFFTGDLARYSGKWPQWGSMQNGECWEHARPDFLTSVKDSGVSLPTPSGVNGGKNHTMGRIDEWGGSSNPLRGTVLGSLCLPEFEEMVMGWPIGWTALTPLGMDKFQQWLRLHGEHSHEHARET